VTNIMFDIKSVINVFICHHTIYGIFLLYLLYLFIISFIFFCQQTYFLLAPLNNIRSSFLAVVKFRTYIHFILSTDI